MARLAQSPVIRWAITLIAALGAQGCVGAAGDERDESFEIDSAPLESINYGGYLDIVTPTWAAGWSTANCRPANYTVFSVGGEAAQYEDWVERPDIEALCNDPETRWSGFIISYPERHGVAEVEIYSVRQLSGPGPDGYFRATCNFDTGQCW